MTSLSIGLGLTSTTVYNPANTGGAPAWSPAELFATGAEGTWIDPANSATLFQDVAGTQPVTAAGQSVARIEDLSGNGNHMIEPTAGLRPTLETDGTRSWLETTTAQRLRLPAMTYANSGTNFCLGTRRISVYLYSWRARTNTGYYAGLSHPSAAGTVSNLGGSMRVDGNIAATSRETLYAQVGDGDRVLTALDCATVALSGQETFLMSYGLTGPVAARLYAYVEISQAAPLDALARDALEAWTAAKMA